MKSLLRALLFLLLAPTCFAETTDRTGCQDHPLFTRMPGYIILSCENQDFATHEFWVRQGRDLKVLKPEGKYTRLVYQISNSATRKPASPLEVIRNHQNAIKAIGGQVLLESESGTTLKLVKSGKETFIAIGGFSKQYTIDIIEVGRMEQTVTATDISSTLDAQGRIALYGITFDLNKANLKPESEATLQTMADVLKAAPKLSVFIVGHTDNTGDHATNLKLSRARAEAVKVALTSRFGIDATRLSADGVAAMCPVATHTNEAGRALNRRVEMVKR